jgi:flagellin
MNEAATEFAALQVQQQLDVQALSISNSNARVILKLFQL